MVSHLYFFFLLLSSSFFLLLVKSNIINPVDVGDIAATTQGERVRCLCFCKRVSVAGASDSIHAQVFCIFLFLYAVSLFGTIIAEINEIVGQVTTKKKDLDHILESYLSLRPRWADTQLTISQQHWWWENPIFWDETLGLETTHVFPPPSFSLSVLSLFIRLDGRTMFKIREWERFKFLMDYDHHQVSCSTPEHSISDFQEPSLTPLVPAAKIDPPKITARKVEALYCQKDRKQSVL
jgi:hypothetical protein